MFRKTKNCSLHLLSSECGNWNHFELLYNWVKRAEMSLDETGWRALSLSIWNSRSRQTELKSVRISVPKIWELMDILALGFVIKKICTESESHYLTHTHLGGHSTIITPLLGVKGVSCSCADHVFSMFPEAALFKESVPQWMYDV